LPDPFDSQWLEPLLDLALKEDLGPGDLTTESVLPPGARARAVFVAEVSGVLAGLPILPLLFARLDPKITVNFHQAEGASLSPGDAIAEITGPAAPILSGERLALNFLQRLSGIATLTRRFVNAVDPRPAKILDTRKTTPGWRRLEKYAVRVGGGQNHRLGLYDQVLLKENHLQFLGGGPAAVGAAVRQARAAVPPPTRVEVEVETQEEFLAAVDAGADIIMLDNMSPDEMRACVGSLVDRSPRPIIEASGGVTLENVAEIAATGVDWISVGALTHSAPALDLSLRCERLE